MSFTASKDAQQQPRPGQLNINLSSYKKKGDRIHRRQGNYSARHLIYKKHTTASVSPSVLNRDRIAVELMLSNGAG